MENYFLAYSALDMYILCLCIFTGILGGLVDHTLKRDDLINLPIIEPNPMPTKRWFPLLLARIFLGMIAGIVIWLLLIGSMKETKDAISNLLLLSGLGGFMAPSFASKYSKKIDKFLYDQVSK